MIQLSSKAKQAFAIGSLCSMAYLAVYVARNVLGSVSPQMIEQGLFTESEIGSLSSIYFITYAVGQLINGIIGNKVKGKYMISFGLILAGLCNAVFSVCAGIPAARTAAYAMTGFALAMIYAPMTKIVAENTDPVYTHRCCLGYTFASFLASPCAGVLAALLVWQGVFAASSAMLLLMGTLCFTVFTLMERRGLVTYGKYDLPKESGGSIQTLIRRQIIRFTLVSMLTGIVRTTVVFWLPTFISQYLSFSPKNAALIYTVSTFAICTSAFIAIFLYERLKRNMDLTLLIAFSASALFFLLVYLVHLPALCIVFMILAIISANCASTMLWSIYCPRLRDTGMVSGATGFLDFASYVAAAVSSTLFSNAVEDIGWGPLILVWCALMAVGVIVALPRKKAANS